MNENKTTVKIYENEGGASADFIATLMAYGGGKLGIGHFPYKT